MGLWSVSQLAEIVDHEMRAMVPKLIGIPLACDADHETKASGRTGLYSRESILDDNRS